MMWELAMSREKLLNGHENPQGETSQHREGGVM
jgi:hypothetical protein